MSLCLCYFMDVTQKTVNGKEFCIMLKKFFTLFSRFIPEKPYVPPVPVRCYQPELPFPRAAAAFQDKPADFVSRNRQKARR